MLCLLLWTQSIQTSNNLKLKTLLLLSFAFAREPESDLHNYSEAAQWDGCCVCVPDAGELIILPNLVGVSLISSAASMQHTLSSRQVCESAVLYPGQCFILESLLPQVDSFVSPFSMSLSCVLWKPFFSAVSP